VTTWTRTAAEVATITGGSVVGDDAVVVEQYVIDSRIATPGSTFVALRDERDGHDFVDAAFAAGSTSALVEQIETVPSGAAAIVVPDVLDALASLARARLADLEDPTVVGITGSTGKTSTKDLTAAALRASRRVHANPASWNNEFGVPLTVLSAPSDTHTLVVEMGERRPGDVHYLSEIVHPSIGVVTNVGLAHAEHLGGPEGVAAVLGELVRHIPPSGFVVLDADDEASRALGELAEATTVTVGSHDADVRVHDVTVDAELKVHASYSTPWGTVRVGLPLRGVHQARNAAFALAVAGVTAVDLEVAADALTTAPTAPWRMNVTTSPRGVVVINDAYNANPASMRAGLDALAALAVPGRRIAVLGEMRELGQWSDEAHRSIGAVVHAHQIDQLIVVGTGADALAETAREAGVATVSVADAEAAIDCLIDDVTDGDAVFVKASRAVGLEKVAAALMEATA